MVLDKSYRMNTTQEFQILLRKLSSKTKRCLNSIERSAEEQKTVKEIPYTPFLRVKITVFLAHSGVFLWLEKHDWQLWDMTNWLKHPGEEHYFWAKSHKNTFSGIFVGFAWKVCYVAKGKIRWHFGVKLEINEPRKILWSPTKNLWWFFDIKMLWWWRHAIHHTQIWKLHIQRLSTHLTCQGGLIVKNPQNTKRFQM